MTRLRMDHWGTLVRLLTAGPRQCNFLQNVYTCSRVSISGQAVIKLCSRAYLAYNVLCVVASAIVSLKWVVPSSCFVMSKYRQRYGPFIVRFVNCVDLRDWIPSRQLPILTINVLKCISPNKLAQISWNTFSDMDAFYKSFGAALSVLPSASSGLWSLMPS